MLIAMSLVYYINLKSKYSFDKIVFHTFVVLIRQNSILKPLSVVENLLLISWVLGAMFLCLAYDFVFLSFLAFPPVIPIKDVPQLAKAVKEGHYHCRAVPESAVLAKLEKSENENLRIIAQGIQRNNLNTENTFVDFFLRQTQTKSRFYCRYRCR